MTPQEMEEVARRRYEEDLRRIDEMWKRAQEKRGK